MGEVKSIQKSDRAEIQLDQQTTKRMVESLVLRGDISALNPEERANYYVQLCTSLGLTPATQPFAILRLNGKEICYPTRGATDQLAAIHRLTREIIEGPRLIDIAGTKLFYAVCRATHPNGRSETAVATVPLTDPANVMMKCETKAKRRATLSILGLGMLDETEVESIPAHAKSAAPPIVLQNQPAAPENDLAHDPPAQDTPALDALNADLDDVDERGTDLLRAARIWRKHKDAVYAEAGGSAEYLYEAQKAVLGVTKVSATRNQLNEHVAALEMRDKTPRDSVYADVMDLLELADSAEDVAETIQKHKPAIDLRAEEIRDLLRKVAVRRVQELVPGMTDAKTAAQWLKNALAPKDPPKPPNGGGTPKPEAPAANDSDPERDAIMDADHVRENNQFAQASAEDRLIAYVASKANVYELQNGIEKHFDEFKPSREQLVRIVVPRLVELSANTQTPLTQMGAINVCRAIYANAKQPKSRKKGKAA